mmetsp:Transcript_27688/g.55344  ORF Transcript_27688/g.55344 Transcript_27688/m.55344 type:complete len:309 (-) Transcript_27688:78-1004(-)|eukprot:CAMPEP_0182461564 /NCGR_PEP_ID=MMETSP1319-20130603/6103_1 /TAXON_ID=172717 /ORGANISM="Bolidomonas pacifica, Strain RCC208" /LENGTH=308 /DNA_ID=CAMNT_0024660871 /DNA_START=16 /DNA_END=942 /DNA_ORIENTATION=-
MALPIPPELKRITPFVRRAEELDNDSQPKSRLIAYYCRQYAVELALPLLKTAKDPASKSTLLAIMSSLETEKAAVGDAFTKVEAYSVTRDFSNGVLRQADRSYATIYAANVRDYGKGKGIARSYYAAGVFFDVLGLFETSGVEEAVLEKELIEQRRKYCKWRAALILNAAKKGEDLPVPVAEEEEGGEGDDDAMEEEKEEETKGGETKSGGDEKDDFDIPEAPTGRPPESAPVFEPTPPPASAPAPAPAPSPGKQRGSWFGGGGKASAPSKAAVADAIELAKFAVAALEGKEIDLARKRLKDALACLG